MVIKAGLPRPSHTLPMSVLTGSFYFHVRRVLPQLSKQQALRDGVGAGLPTCKVWKRFQHQALQLPATRHSWTVLIEINGLLSHSLGRLLREWILGGRGGRVQEAAKAQAYISGGRDKYRLGALRKICLKVRAQLTLHGPPLAAEDLSQLWTSWLLGLSPSLLSPEFRHESTRETRKQCLPCMLAQAFLIFCFLSRGPWGLFQGKRGHPSTQYCHHLT